MEEKGAFHSTFGWHPRSVVAALATIRYFIAHRKRLLSNVAAMSDHFEERLAGLRFRRGTTLRIQGLAIGIELKTEAYASKIQARCRREGMLLSAEGSTLLMFPALNIDQAVADRGLNILARCL